MPAMLTTSEGRVLLRGIRWETYERLAGELEDPGVRLTYDHGALEIMATSYRHERCKKLLGRMIEAMTEVLDVPIRSGGAMTLGRRDLERGIEPDEYYGVRHEPAVRARTEIHLLVDPPPDLAIEAEVTRSILDRLAILAAIGIDEVWRYDGRRLTILVRQPAGTYQPSAESQCFPWLPVDGFVEHLQRSSQAEETAWIRAFRAWVHSAVPRP